MSEEQFELRLYVAGQTPKSARAFTNLRTICEEHLSGRYRIEVIDLLKDPQLGRLTKLWRQRHLKDQIRLRPRRIARRVRELLKLEAAANALAQLTQLAHRLGKLAVSGNLSQRGVDLVGDLSEPCAGILPDDLGR